ncbi:MAG: putative DNA binding domain-containing protein [Lachnospiraceae bacterium]|nr:putative DNA binding domain-containing protein [Lachnospiraceae bacterium]
MAESQNIEYKESWRDEYLKWVCGFANAQGGTIYIGIDDAGNVVGVKNVKKLLEDIPNKIQTGLGIVADVNKHTKSGKDYLEIIVKPSSFPISYHGEFHYRSGATKQQLTGIALSEFIMQKTGFRWEDVTVDNITVDDLDDESFKIFRREALSKRRMTEKELNVPNAELLQKLHLITDGKLKRSAVLLFYRDPSVIQNGSFVKVGKFDERGRVVYHNDLEESLIVNASKVIDLIYQMYLKAKIRYEHDVRVEEYPFAREAIREAVYNAIAHNCYMYGMPIQIRVMDDTITISNSCILPEGWTVDTLMEPHDSKPYNPDIANVFYRAGFIENWGQGIQKICDECQEIGAELPVYELLGTTLRIRFQALESALIDQPKAPKHQNMDKAGALEDTMVLKVIEVLKEQPDISQEVLGARLGITRRVVQKYINVLKETGRIERIGGKRYGYWKIN